MSAKQQRWVTILVSVIMLTLIGIITVSAVTNQSSYLPAVMDVGDSPIATPTPGLTPPPTIEPTITPTPPDFHFDDCAFRTGSNATIAVPSDVSIVGGISLSPGDEIAVFTPDGTLCAGMSVWTGENIAITAWGNDTQTDEVDGLRNGEEMTYRIWLASDMTELTVSEVGYSVGGSTYQDDGIYVIASFTIE